MDEETGGGVGQPQCSLHPSIYIWLDGNCNYIYTTALANTGRKSWGQQSEQRDGDLFVKVSFLGSTLILFFLAADPYQPNRRLVLSSLTSAAITFSQEALGETECIDSFAVSVWINWVTLCVLVCAKVCVSNVLQLRNETSKRPCKKHNLSSAHKKYLVSLAYSSAVTGLVVEISALVSRQPLAILWTTAYLQTHAHYVQICICNSKKVQVSLCGCSPGTSGSTHSPITCTLGWLETVNMSD